MIYENFGMLTVHTVAADSALPIPEVAVRVFGQDEENRDVAHFLLTDIDGRSEPLRLPTPSAQYSKAPSPAEKPYASYELVVIKDGYYTKRLRDVAVFSGITTVLEVNMIPAINGAGISSENTESTSTENPSLE